MSEKNNSNKINQTKSRFDESNFLETGDSPRNRSIKSNQDLNIIEENKDELSELSNASEILREIFEEFSEYDIFSLARHGNYDILECLLLKGISPDSKDIDGNTIIIIGAQNGNKRIIKLALRYGAQINMKNCNGNTALHFCTEYVYEEIANYLIKKGANPNIANLKGFKAYEGLTKKANLGKSIISSTMTYEKINSKKNNENTFQFNSKKDNINNYSRNKLQYKNKFTNILNKFGSNASKNISQIIKEQKPKIV